MQDSGGHLFYYVVVFTQEPQHIKMKKMKKIHLFEKAKGGGGYWKNFAVQQIIERGAELVLLYL
jgi:hypothetical protein